MKNGLLDNFIKIILILILTFSISLSCGKNKKDNDSDSETNRTFKWYSFDEGIKLASKENKLMFVDFYADWCGYCKKMEKEVFSKKEIQKILINNFIPVKIDTDTRDDRIDYLGKKKSSFEIAVLYLGGRFALPTYIFIDKNGRIFKERLFGFQFPEQFKKILKKFKEDYNQN